MRYQLLFTSLMLVFFSVHSQQPPQTKVDSMLVNIDKSEFSTGILYDRTVPWANLNSFNDNKNISSVRYFEQALEELYRGSNEKKFKSYKTFVGVMFLIPL